MLFNRKSKTIRISKIATFCALFFTSIVFFSCALTLRSPYDAYTDQIMMQLFTEIETFFQTIDRYSGPPECEYDSNKDFYLRINVQCEVKIVA